MTRSSIKSGPFRFPITEVTLVLCASVDSATYLMTPYNHNLGCCVYRNAVVKSPMHHPEGRSSRAMFSHSRGRVPGERAVSLDLFLPPLGLDVQKYRR